MTAIKKLLLCNSFCLAMSAAALPAHAEPLINGKETMPAKYIQRIMLGMKGLVNMDNSDAAKGLYSKLYVWPPTYAKLRVCFMSDNNKVNAAVAKVASGWNKVADISLKLDFGKMTSPRRCDAKGRESQIRVTYDQPGYWSQIGQNSIVYAAQDEPSLNLEGFDKVPNVDLLLQGDLKGTILHEFGHALGLLHEHQSPVATCANEFNWDFVVNYLKGPPNNWTEDVIRFNLAPYAGEEFMMTDFDPQSIMLYSFPAEYYLEGSKSECYIGESNVDISASDKAAIEYMYPVDVAARAKNFEQSRAQLMQIVKAAEQTGTKSAGMDYVEAFFGAKGVAADEE